MYVPAHFAPDAALVDELLRNHGAADLVTLTERGLVATMLPFIYVPSAGAHGALHGHVARNNDQWKLDSAGEALAIVRGPDAYITPGWYASKAEHGRVVPTWNYSTVHLTGRARVHEDSEWLRSAVTKLTDRHEAERSHRWHVTDAPAAFVADQLKAIVGIEIRVERVEGKAKLSQNRSEADQRGVISGLRGEPAPAAAAMADAIARRLPAE